MQKLKAAINLSKKAGKAIFGTNKIEQSNYICLIIASSSLAASGIKKLQKKCAQTIIIPSEQYNALDISSLAVAITDPNLANLVKNQIK